MRTKRPLNRRLWLPIVCLFLLPVLLPAQDLEGFWSGIRNRWQNDPVLINGGLSAGMMRSFVQGMPARRDGFNWNLNANLNIDLLGIAIPFSAHVSDGNALYNLPSYQFVGFSPSYKWITLHGGDRSMEFSPYTLSGHNFTGGGLELTPGKFRFAAMYGRLKRATAGDFTANQNLDPSFRRMGWGFKAGYGTAEDFIDLILFSASDDLNSVDTTFVQNLPPATNVVMGVTGRKKLSQQFSLLVDFAHSIFTDDATAPMLEDTDRNLMNSAFGLLKPRVSTYQANALRSELQWAMKRINWRLSYERIDPNYRTLGTIFINNDLENYTVGAGFQLFKKLGINLNGGLQRNNLAGTQATTLRRLIGSISANLSLNDRLSFNAGYSNFYNTQKVRALINPVVPVDSIFLAQINENATFGASLVVGKEKNGTLSIMLAYQNANALENDELLPGASDFYNANFGYSHQFKGIGLQAYGALNVSRLLSDDFDNWNVGPTVSLSKSWLDKKLSTQLSSSWTGVWQQWNLKNNILNLQLGASYQMLKDHQLSFRFSLINRKVLQNIGSPQFTEGIASLNYGYTFSQSAKRK
ncbi:MAG: hypothetical protein AAFO94_01130 [Bacteroidota bacterium]